ncbi:glycosyltransferase family 2 protein [Patescibacteria group bacterium]|nr:MAG: glycosyltransferase family 2 protein [Patescibacteria group bacterium]
MARLSVIVPAHDAAATLRACLESVLAQTLPADEIIVVDDGSTDGTAGIARSVDPRIVVCTQRHGGAAAARNEGVRMSSGELLFFCDADLLLDPRLLEKLGAALAGHPEASFAYCGFRWGGKTFGMRAFDAEAVKRNNYISTMSLIRRGDFPGFDPSLERFQDWDLWLTMIARGKKGVGVPEVLFTVQTRGSMSHRGGLSRLRATRIIRKKHGLRMRFADYLVALKEALS